MKSLLHSKKPPSSSSHLSKSSLHAGRRRSGAVGENEVEGEGGVGDEEAGVVGAQKGLRATRLQQIHLTPKAGERVLPRLRNRVMVPRSRPVKKRSSQRNRRPTELRHSACRQFVGIEVLREE